MTFWSQDILHLSKILNDAWTPKISLIFCPNGKKIRSQMAKS